MPYNEFGQALGQALPSFTAGPLPEMRSFRARQSGLRN